MKIPIRTVDLSTSQMDSIPVIRSEMGTILGAGLNFGWDSILWITEKYWITLEIKKSSDPLGILGMIRHIRVWPNQLPLKHIESILPLNFGQRDFHPRKFLIKCVLMNNHRVLIKFHVETGVSDLVDVGLEDNFLDQISQDIHFGWHPCGIHMMKFHKEKKLWTIINYSSVPVHHYDLTPEDYGTTTQVWLRIPQERIFIRPTWTRLGGIIVPRFNPQQKDPIVPAEIWNGSVFGLGTKDGISGIFTLITNRSSYGSLSVFDLQNPIAL